MIICPIGTSRLHRPLAKRYNSSIVVNSVIDVEVCYPKIGYFHSPEEMLQVANVLCGLAIPPHFLKFCFRAEPVQTTPLNEFCPTLRHAALEEQEFRFNVERPIDIFVIEISSLITHRHNASGYIFHSNPNLFRSVEYKEIWKDGFYEKYAPELGVSRYESTYNEVRRIFTSITNKLVCKHVVFMGHLNGTVAPNYKRTQLNDIVRRAAIECGAAYFDNAHYVDQFGFATDSNGVVDIHHLTHEGEMALGRALQEFCLLLGA